MYFYITTYSSNSTISGYLLLVITARHVHCLTIDHLSDELYKLSQLCSDRRVVTFQPYCVKKMREMLR